MDPKFRSSNNGVGIIRQFEIQNKKILQAFDTRMCSTQTLQQNADFNILGTDRNISFQHGPTH